MDNTRVSAQPDEVAERSEQVLQITVRLRTISSARHLNALLLDILSKRGHKVDSVRIWNHEKLLSSFDRTAMEGAKP